LGCNHVVDLGPKTTVRSQSPGFDPLRVGTLMRLGPGEAQYKGNELFIELIERLQKSSLIEACLMGRGTEDDRKHWEQKGFEVHLNSSDAERETYLRSLDVFVSSSQWEGFNLPLVEAQALGTLGLAYDVGAHPETTPFVMPSMCDAEAFIHAVNQDHELLLASSELGRQFVRNKFDWERTAANFAGILEVARLIGPRDSGSVSCRTSISGRLSALVRREGLLGAGRIIVKKLLGRTGHR
jgi:glycosyltransferase involved in cell wall biosynthesis